jgi:hypothetical protein
MEKTILLNSLQRLREVRKNHTQPLELAMEGGVVTVDNRIAANRVSRQLKKMWREKYPDLFL